MLRGCLAHVFPFSFACFVLVCCRVIAGICSGYLIIMPRVFVLASYHLMCALLQIDLRRANNCGIMLTKVKMPLPDLMVKRCDNINIYYLLKHFFAMIVGKYNNS